MVIPAAVCAQLTPEEMTEVHETHAFATPVWLDRVAQSFRPAGSMRNSQARPTAELLAKLSVSKETEPNSVHPFVASRARLTGDAEKLLIVMVGLPARGKSLVSNRVCGFLSWRGWRTQHFSVGARRRQSFMKEGEESPSTRLGSSMSSFFNSDMTYAKMVREKVAMQARHASTCGRAH